MASRPKPHPTDETSPSLLQRIRDQDDLAWARLLDLYGPLVYGWCRRAGLNNEEASDLMQDVFLSVSQNIEGFRRDEPSDSFRGWLRVMTRNRIATFFRNAAGKARATGGSTAQTMIQAVPDDEEDEASDLEERSGLYNRALRLIQTEFEEATWRAFIETAVNHRAAPEVARDLQMSPGAVRQARYRVLRRLRREFGDFLDDATPMPP